MTRSGPARRGDEGSGSLWVLWMLTVTACVAGALVAAGEVAVQHAQAVTAADLAALGGADALQHSAGESDACASAQRIAGSNGAALQSCVVSGETVEVVVINRRLRPGGTAARATARAGPALP